MSWTLNSEWIEKKWLLIFDNAGESVSYENVLGEVDKAYRE
tara:strand:+ start:1975 stop:2097 length:123 start_codon:yes stop_codon:yes gene_type:complete